MHVLIVGGRRAARMRAALGTAGPPLDARRAIIAIDAGALPFVRRELLKLPAPPRSIVWLDCERAFPDAQAGGTRLVLTQSTYLVQRWLDALAPGDRIVATADRIALARSAPDALQARGPWRQFTLVDLDAGLLAAGERDSGVRRQHGIGRQPARGVRLARLLARAFRANRAAERQRLCRLAAAAAPRSAVAALALASACRERQHLSAARDALDRAMRLAPEWEAAHYENGKFWLACEDLPRARDAFARASALMPSFSAAFGNLGAIHGELGEPEAAAAAFDRALESDPDSFTILNNIGVVNRELGNLVKSEAALRRVVALAPDFVFGHYNLGHTLFLSGRFEEARTEYEEGQRRDPQQNRRQGCRLALVRFAAGDAGSAERDFWRFANLAPPEEREDLLLEAYETGQALVQSIPGLERDVQFLERIAAAIQVDR